MMRVLRPLLPYARLLRRRRGAALLGAALLLATVLSAVGLLGLSGWFITATGITALAWAAGTRSFFEIFLPGSGIRFFALSRTVARYFERLRQHDLTLELLAALRGAVFARLAQQPSATLGWLRNSVLIDRMTADVDAIDNLLLRVLSPSAVAVALLLVVAVGLSLLATPWMLWPVGLLTLAITALCVMALIAGLRPGRTLRARSERLHARIAESLAGLAELRTADTLDGHMRNTAQLDARLRQQQWQRMHRIAAHEAFAGTLVHGAALLALVGGLSLLQGDAMGPAAAVLAALALLGGMEILPTLPAAFYRLGETQTAAVRLNQLLTPTPEDTAEAVPDPEVPAGSEAPALQLEAVTLCFPERAEPALQGVDLRLSRGERVAIVGPSGCGKSSLVQLVGRLYAPQSGRLLLGGHASTMVSAQWWRGQLGILTQHSELFADSIRANLLLAAPDADDAALWRALQIAALDAVVRQLPDGLDTWVGEHGTRLSGGQARRLALARVVLRDPPLVILDEPCTGLDAATAAIVRERLNHWLSGRSALLLAHHPDSLPAHDRVLRLTAGRLTEAAR
ncbi:thiol reductant ABC exporter subunit CydC [Algiphilus sp.]|uniref:thiol reductant ABC exporter subunit CydC n=1 Tax=Algiphilus sp. TaxID=1872431 RepID=UPI003B5233B8